MPNLPAVPSFDFDPIRESLDPRNIAVVVFSQSTSQAYEMALLLARGATKYGSGLLGNKEHHAAVFSRETEQVARAAALLKIVMTWKSTQVFTQLGLAPHAFEVADVLVCYLKSLQVVDHRAHCHWVYSELTPKGFGRERLVPCALLKGLYEGIVTNDHIHPSRLEDQVQALAVQRGCSWCPNFRPGV